MERILLSFLLLLCALHSVLSDLCLHRLMSADDDDGGARTYIPAYVLRLSPSLSLSLSLSPSLSQ